MAAAHKITSSQPRRARMALCVAFGVAIVTAAVNSGAGAAPESVAGSDPDALPPAETWTDGGVARTLLEKEEGMVRVRLVLRDQALLAAASNPEIREQLQTAPAPISRRVAARHPNRITQTEQDTAIEAESSYERAIDELQPAADDASDDVERVAAQVEAAGGTVVESDIVPATVIARVPADKLGELEALDTVQAIDASPKPKPQSGVGWQAVGAPSWHAAGFRGGTGPSDTVPADAGVTGELPDPTHPAFSSVVVDNDPALAGQVGDHGTHTAGVIASGDATYRGVAFGADRMVNGTLPYQLGLTYSNIPGAPDPAEVVNLSFGGTASSDNDDDGLDAVVASFGVSDAAAASNDNIDGSPTVDNVGRNILTVGGYNDVGTVSSTDDVVLGSSSRGPSLGGRKKPDLTAPGGAVISADSAWNTPPSNPDFTSETGTSFSSPHVAGAMTLLEGSGVTDPMAQRAILINSARDWNGTDTGLNGWTTGTQTGWRPEVGWGELDLTTALAQRSYYRLGQVGEGEATFYRATVPGGSKATMAFQMRGYIQNYPENGAQIVKYTVSNLDLHAYDSADAEIAPQPAFDPPMTTIDPGPNAQDPNDTVEQLRSPASPASQTVTYKVQSASTIDGAAAEPFALAATAPLTPLVSPTVRPNSLAASATDVRCNQPIQITTTTINDSADLAASSAQVTIQLPAGVSLLSGPATQSVAGGNLATSATSETKTWTLQATSQGAKTITVEGSGDAYDTTFTDSDDVTVTADCTPPGTSIDSGPSGPTNDRTPSFGFSGSGAPTAAECAIDSGAFSACASPFTSAPLEDGQHTFRVRSIDAVGNVEAPAATRAFTVDTVPPDTMIEAGPPGAIRSSHATFSLSGGESFECSLDDAAFMPCPASSVLTGLSDGSHVFAARAIDAAGNVDSTPATRSFRVDSQVKGAQLSARSPQRPRGKRIAKVKVAMSESGSIVVRAKADISGDRLKLNVVRVPLDAAGQDVAPITASPRAARRISKALGHGRVGMEVTVAFTDELGNRVTRKVAVKLRR